MTVTELMTGRTPDPTYKGQITADDMVLALNLNDATDVKDYIVAQPFVSEHSGSLDAQTSDNNYIRAGKVTIKTATTRKISVNGDRFEGDPFQDGILDHAMKYGTGSAVVKDYVYFAIQSGKGEKGSVTVIVDSDASGASGNNLSFSASLTSTTMPTEYSYTGA